ncbi:hypothetical protein O0I10_005958 [Lichtheimia ornata]|uniref:Haloacid dehalogenase-like hydrolase n=1 Tax=Lichtheimia ornata TaxID=688661 RepID=A0AAD7V4V4_9FUNG|nr:uncharacterized protein O0I10_005958 [Lichtheimia ornata]KAJ8658275.1 hypothetical protein O0I10_005958 [Lichtheimia ornata]
MNPIQYALLLIVALCQLLASVECMAVARQALVPRCMSAIKRTLVLTDFDETITNEDTTALLGQVGLDHQHSNMSWSFFVDAYMEDYNRIKSSIPANATIRERLGAFRPAEAASLDRIEKYSVFRGLTRQYINEQGARHASQYLRPGVVDVLQHVDKDNFRIISVNWSKDWILGFLRPLGLDLEHVYSNDLRYYENNHTATGEITHELLTSVDKEDLMDAILRKTPADTRTVYVGDSMGDLLPMMKADVGIVMGNNTKLLDAIRNDFSKDIQEGLDNWDTGVYRVDSWTQILDSGVLKSTTT